MATPATTKEPKMANDTATAPDFAKMDLAALKKLVDTATATFAERKEGELKTLVSGWLLKADAVGYGINDVLAEVRSRLPQPAVKTRAKRGTAAPKETADKDKTGARPEAGKTYVINGVEWTKSASGKGRAKTDFIDAIKGGATWVEMAKK